MRPARWKGLTWSSPRTCTRPKPWRPLIQPDPLPDKWAKLIVHWTWTMSPTCSTHPAAWSSIALHGCSGAALWSTKFSPNTACKWETWLKHFFEQECLKMVSNRLAIGDVWLVHLLAQLQEVPDLCVRGLSKKNALRNQHYEVLRFESLTLNGSAYVMPASLFHCNGAFHTMKSNIASLLLNSCALATCASGP